MDTWQDVIIRFFEGTTDRSELEQLQWTLDLPEEAYAEIQAALDLADTLGGNMVDTSVPNGAVDRALSRLRAEATYEATPAWFQIQPPMAPPVDPEFTIQRFLEGDASHTELENLLDNDRITLDPEVRSEIKRLLHNTPQLKLAGVEEEEEVTNTETADEDLGPIARIGGSNQLPDVIAAGKPEDLSNEDE